MKALLSVLILISMMFLISCSEPPEKEIPEVSPEFKELLDAHGDWSKWIHAKAMSFVMIHETNLTQENYFVNLDSRKIRLDGNNFSIGKDDEGTWVSPNRQAFGGQSVDFYHNLYFYFYAFYFYFYYLLFGNFTVFFIFGLS